MAQSVQKIPLSSSRDIPFNKLVLSQSNVRRVKAGASIEELAEDIARRALLQSLNVRPVIGADGVETGMFEVPTGGRRYRARIAGQAEALRQERARSCSCAIPAWTSRRRKIAAPATRNAPSLVQATLQRAISGDALGPPAGWTVF
jgi:hypothetical protein